MVKMSTDNNDLSARQYIKQYSQILNTVFNATKAFEGAFAPIQTFDGIKENDTAFSVKTNATPVVIGDYDKGANVGFGTGTGNSSRFGERSEIIYANTDVDYSYDLKIHEGIDRHTVNNDLNAALSDRFELHAQAQTRNINVRNGAFLSANAGNTETLSTYYFEAIRDMFNRISKYYVDLEVIVPVKAYVQADLYNAIIDMKDTNSGKGSSVSLDGNALAKYKGFTLIETPSQYFANGDIAYFAPDSVCIPFVGIQTARTIESEDFDGVALQAAVKGGQFIIDDNKKAVTKVVFADTSLSALTIGSLTLSPAFRPGVMNYTASTTNATNVVTATANAAGATIALDLNGTAIDSGSAATWTAGANTVTITVTTGGVSAEYVVTVTKS
jgi:hypothetical protein